MHIARNFGAVALAVSLISTTLAYADPAAPANTQGALEPGKPVGVQAAQNMHPIAIWVVGIGIVAGGILLATSGQSNNKVGATITSTGP